MPRERGLEPQAIAQRQARTCLENVLDKQREDGIPVLLEGAPALSERTNAPEQEVCHRGIGIVSGEAVGPVLKKVIVMVEAGALVRASDRQIMTALDPPDSSVPVKRGARQDRIGASAETEKARDAERLDRLVRRLIDVLDAEVAHVGRVLGRAPARALARDGESEIIEQPRAENVGFLKRGVVGPVRSLIRIGEQVVVRQDSRL